MKKNIDKIVNHTLMSERSLERYLAERVTELGGLCMKYHNPSHIGFPDRICILPGGITKWVELKSTGRTARPIQQIRIDQLERLGHYARVCDSREAIEEVLRDEV